MKASGGGGGVGGAEFGASGSSIKSVHASLVGGDSRSRVLLAIVVEIDGLERLPENRRVTGRMWEGSVGRVEGRFEWIFNVVVGMIWILMGWQISYI